MEIHNFSLTREDDRCLHVALLYDIQYKCQLNLSIWEQQLLPVLDVFGIVWVIKRPSQGPAAEMLPKPLNPTYYSWTQRGLLQTRSPSLSSYPTRTRLSSSSYRRPTADKLVIPIFLLAGSVLSRNHGLATFVHERLKWSLLDQSHWPSLITPPKHKVPAHSDPVKHCNFRNADWKHFCLLTDESVERLPPPE